MSKPLIFNIPAEILPILQENEQKMRENMNKLPSPLTIAWCKKNKKIVQEMNAKFDKEKNPSHWHRKGDAEYYKTRVAAHKLRAEKLNRTAAWADEAKIEEIFRNCPPDMTIHHEFPLQAAGVSGLHHEANLKYVTLSENCRIHNSFTPRRFVINRGSISLV
jgi:hypothetical protein